MEPARRLVQGMWGVDLDEYEERRFGAYLRFCHAQDLNPPEEILFVIDLLKRNANIPKGVLKDAILDFQKQILSGDPGDLSKISSNVLNMPTMFNNAEGKVIWPKFDVDRVLAKGVLIMLATDLAMKSSSLSGHSITVWEDSKSLGSIMESTLPRLRSSTPLIAFDSSMQPRVSQIQSNKLRARYLCDFAKVEIVWTKHLPDHLELEGKRLRIFELASYLELSRAVIGDSQTDLSASLAK